MQTSGHGNDSLMILVPVGVSIVVGVILFGGPAETVEAINAMVRDLVSEALMLAAAWF
jgi:hypothetical protein